MQQTLFPVINSGPCAFLHPDGFQSISTAIGAGNRATVEDIRGFALGEPEAITGIRMVQMFSCIPVVFIPVLISPLSCVIATLITGAAFYTSNKDNQTIRGLAYTHAYNIAPSHAATMAAAERAIAAVRDTLEVAQVLKAAQAPKIKEETKEEIKEDLNGDPIPNLDTAVRRLEAEYQLIVGNRPANTCASLPYLAIRTAECINSVYAGIMNFIYNKIAEATTVHAHLVRTKQDKRLLYIPVIGMSLSLLAFTYTLPWLISALGCFNWYAIVRSDNAVARARDTEAYTSRVLARDTEDHAAAVRGVTKTDVKLDKHHVRYARAKLFETAVERANAALQALNNEITASNADFAKLRPAINALSEIFTRMALPYNEDTYLQDVINDS